MKYRHPYSFRIAKIVHILPHYKKAAMGSFFPFRTLVGIELSDAKTLWWELDFFNDPSPIQGKMLDAPIRNISILKVPVWELRFLIYIVRFVWAPFIRIVHTFGIFSRIATGPFLTKRLNLAMNIRKESYPPSIIATYISTECERNSRVSEQ